MSKRPPDRLVDGRRQGWFWIHNHTLDTYLPKVGGNAWSVYCYLVRRANKQDQCWPSVATIARETHISRTTVKAAIRKLQEHDLLTVEPQYDPESGDPTSNLYTILEGGSKSDLPRTETDLGVGLESGRGVGQNPATNNTHLNKTQEEESDPYAKQVWSLVADRLRDALPASLGRDLDSLRPVTLRDGTLVVGAPNTTTVERWEKKSREVDAAVARAGLPDVVRLVVEH